MYDYGYDYGAVDYGSAAGIFGGMLAGLGVMLLISSAIGILMLISQWKIYKKAGKGGWECLIPIYNIIVLLDIVKLPTWYVALLLVPFANIYVMFKMYIELAHKFGKSTGFGVLTVFFSVILLPILAFSKDCVYQDGQNMVSTTPTMGNTQYNPQTFENQFNNVNNGMNYNNQVTPNPVPYNMDSSINPMPTQQSTLSEPQTPINNFNQEIAPQPMNQEVSQLGVNNQPSELNVASQQPIEPATSDVNMGEMPQNNVDMPNPEPVIITGTPEVVSNIQPEINNNPNIPNQVNPFDNNQMNNPNM